MVSCVWVIAIQIKEARCVIVNVSSHVYLIWLFTASPVSMETVHVDPDTSPQDSIVGPPQDDDRVSPC